MNLILNGEFYSDQDPILKSNNRAFRYGDSLFETIRVIEGEMQMPTEHLRRLLRGMVLLKMEVPDYFDLENFKELVKKLLDVNKITGDARVRLTVFRKEGGWYAPKTNSIDYMIEVSTLEEQGYELNKRGWKVAKYYELTKPYGKIFQFKTGSSLMNVMAGIYRKQNDLDDCLILNHQGDIIEATASNLFVVIEGALYTPPVTDGCVDGVMRRRIMKLAVRNDIDVFEKTLYESDLVKADELFLTNAVNGIRWVVAFQKKRYFHKMAERLTALLNSTKDPQETES